MCKILGSKTIYDTASLLNRSSEAASSGYDFLGWGIEDHWLMDLVGYYPGNQIIIFTGMWAHIWHESQKYTDKDIKRNQDILGKLRKNYRRKLLSRRIIHRARCLLQKNRKIKDVRFVELKSSEPHPKATFDTMLKWF